MFLASEAVRTFTAVELLFALFQAVVFVAVLIWVKLALYRRRMEETNEDVSRSQHLREPDSGMAAPGLSSAHAMPKVRSSPSTAASRTLRSRARRLRKRINQTGAKTNAAPLKSPQGLQRTQLAPERRASWVLRNAKSPQTKLTNLMKTRKIIITAPDHARLSDLITFGNLSFRERDEARVLEAELERAEIAAPNAIPPA